jgi:glycosyltransferase involved in cell wall biosynthesis
VVAAVARQDVEGGVVSAAARRWTRGTTRRYDAAAASRRYGVIPDVVWWVLLALYAFVALRWLWVHVELARAVRAGLLEPAAHVESDAPSARVSVLIAAHNEAETIGRCLERVLTQNYANLQVIVANDRSTDATEQIVRDVAREHPNVECVNIEELPDGWLGKTHALATATPYAQGEYLVFTDSDVEWHPAMLATVIDLAQRERLDFLSLWPKVVVASFWERLLLPACAWVLCLWFPGGRPDRVESTAVFANGQFLVIHRQAYEKIGGHAAVRNEMAEDIALAQRARAAGLRRYVGLGVRLLRTRMYASLTEIIRGWTRIYIGALQARWKLVFSLGALILGCLPPFLVLAAAAVSASGDGLTSLGWAWVIVATIHLLAMYSAAYRHFRLVFDGGPYVFLFPLACLGVSALLAYCMLLMGGIGTVRWGSVRYEVRGSRAVRSRRVAD